MESDYKAACDLISEMADADLRKFTAWLRENKDAAEHPWDNSATIWELAREFDFRCPDCDEELDMVHHSRSVRMKREGTRWLETDVFSEEYSCAKCSRDLDQEDISESGLK